MTEYLYGEKFLKTYRPLELGRRVYLMHTQLGLSYKVPEWEEFGGPEGLEVTLGKIPSFLQARGENILKFAPDPTWAAFLSDPLAELEGELTLLEQSRELNSVAGNIAAREYFRRQLSGAWYNLTNHSLEPLMNREESSWQIIQSCRKAITLLAYKLLE